MALRYIPPLESFLKDLARRKKFEVERALIAGEHVNTNEHPSIIHFSFNKAATQYVKSILRRCAIENGMTPVGINEYAFDTDFPFLGRVSAQEMEQYAHIFKKTGYLYSVFGSAIAGIPHIEQYKIVLVARDPRDILVSDYFSKAYSHVVPSSRGDKRDQFMAERERALASTIDEYAIANSEKIAGIFSQYRTLFLERYPHVYVTTYEAMLSDFASWLSELLDYCELDASQQLFQSLVQANEDKKPKKEDKLRHVRRGQSGDYKEKLKPETIEHLDAKFAPMLAEFGYD